MKNTSSESDQEFEGDQSAENNNEDELDNNANPTEADGLINSESQQKRKRNKLALKEKPEDYTFQLCILLEKIGCRGEALYRRVGIEENPFVCKDHKSQHMQLLWRSLVEENFEQNQIANPL